MKNNKYYPKNLTQAIFLLFAYIMLVSLMFVLILVTGLRDELDQSLTDLIIVALSTIIIIVILHYRNSAYRSIFTDFKLIKFRLMIISTLVILIFQYGMLSWSSYFILRTGRVDSVFTAHSVYFILGTVIVGPIIEEIMFRGIVLKGLLISYNVKKAIISSALLFGIIHINIAHFDVIKLIGPILLGLFVGWIYSKTSNLLLCILIHSFSNILGLTAPHVYNYIQNHIVALNSSNIFLISSIILLCSSILIVYLVKYLKVFLG